MSRLVILDRDGVINADSDYFVRSIAEWQPLPGSIEAIAHLHEAGFVVTVASNQSGVGRGLFTRETVYGMHKKLRRLVRAAGGEIAAIAFCPHHPDKGCSGRKPRTGLYTRLANETGLPLDGAIVIGDSLRDLEAGDRVGAELWLVRTGKGARSLKQAADKPPAWWPRVRIADDLAAVVAQVTA
ncbi:MAG: D-glycero-beta-D-manno-heptose 1,7-bisphosphate 7-phosphatase [Pseudomonadota bacterium]